MHLPVRCRKLPGETGRVGWGGYLSLDLNLRCLPAALPDHAAQAGALSPGRRGQTLPMSPPHLGASTRVHAALALAGGRGTCFSEGHARQPSAQVYFFLALFITVCYLNKCVCLCRGEGGTDAAGTGSRGHGSSGSSIKAAGGGALGPSTVCETLLPHRGPGPPL